MVIKRVSPLSVAKVAGLLYALLGLIFGGLFSLLAMAGGFASALEGSDSGSIGPIVGLVFGAGAVIVLPIFYGVMGFIVTAIMAVIYNFAAGVVGGVEIDVQ